jgi:hypothetical protein
MMGSVVQLNGWLAINENVGSEFGWKIQMDCAIEPPSLVKVLGEYPMQMLPFRPKMKATDAIVGERSPVGILLQIPYRGRFWQRK